MNNDALVVIYGVLVLILVMLTIIWSDVHKGNDLARTTYRKVRAIEQHLLDDEDGIARAIEQRQSPFGPVRAGLVEPAPTASTPSGYDRHGRPTYEDQLEDIRHFEQPQLFDQEADFEQPVATVHDLSARRRRDEDGEH